MKSIHARITGIPISERTADATHAQTVKGVGDAFSDIECRDLTVMRVKVGSRAYTDLRKRGDLEDGDGGPILWGAEVKLVSDGVLTVWDERKAPGRIRRKR